ncbi:hypothetical protein L596_024275 [Steinernema carpocapsae]|uniref:Uncharacterized protein n=1 Tax=Steinernema carpocapsae TaxID=34508 RepID=A0A4U5MGB2_STECR|nr:hypothetical protein L596_024275 [Steinernema carpocapsae]
METQKNRSENIFTWRSGPYRNAPYDQSPSNQSSSRDSSFPYSLRKEPLGADSVSPVHFINPFRRSAAALINHLYSSSPPIQRRPHLHKFDHDRGVTSIAEIGFLPRPNHFWLTFPDRLWLSVAARD